MSRLLRSIVLILLAFAMYIVYTGSVRLYDIVTGVLIAVPVGLMFANIVISDWRKSLDPKRLGYLIVYTFKYFLIHEVRAHIDVIKRGLSPSMPVNPGIVRVPIESDSEYAITMVSIAITNTPGTVVVDLDKNRKVLYVHWINVKGTDPNTTYLHIARGFDRYAKKVFD